MEIGIAVFIAVWMTTSVVLAYRQLRKDFDEPPKDAPSGEGEVRP